jgi:hypothetical protein
MIVAWVIIVTLVNFSIKIGTSLVFCLDDMFGLTASQFIVGLQKADTIFHVGDEQYVIGLVPPLEDILAATA